ncbi:WIAG-tail domain [Paenibacillus sp. IHB B 3415]|uniref:WIAG-tail domain n=1 Tax=Paenibacillus sp. IHB B 3415 TaxID=867080 RepID=UPI000AA7FCAE|nr:WIAG-tail domain [Paenibacillus sp. IHB B 3415]
MKKLEQLTEETRGAGQLTDGSITGEKLALGSIGTKHLTEGSVGSAELQDEAVDASKITSFAIQSRHLEEDSVQSYHIAQGAVTGDHLAPGSVNPEHLSFSPVQSAGNREVLQQFGMTAFMFNGDAQSVEVTVSFDESFGHTGYVLVAMTNQPYFHASLKNRSGGDATIEVVRLRETPHFYGVLSWIALGSPLVKPAADHRVFD